MIITNKLDKNLFASTSLALGVFDGIHFAHQKVIEDVIEKSKKYGALPAVITFSNHPQNVLSEKKVLNIISTEKKLELMKDFGIKAVVLLEFTKDMAYLSAEDYLKMIVESMNPKSFTLGYNHNFGKDKRGNGDFLRANAEKYGYETSIINSVEIDGHIVSSSLIRKLLSSGKIELVNKLLKRDYSISSQIVEGAKKGRTIGFPTINIKADKMLVPPKNGVYAGYVKLLGETYQAAINVGHAPTFNYSDEVVIESHLFGFDREAYFENAEVFFTQKIRDEKKFSSVEELKENIASDCKKILNSGREIFN